MLTIAAFVVALSVLVVVHEYGHYWVARRCGVKVLRFSVGFGKVLWSRRFGRDGTEWAVAAIPLGGYVKMLDEREGNVDPGELDRAFNRKSVWQRFAIVSAGPIANFLAAILLYWILFVHGLPGLIPTLATPPAASPALEAGFARGDTITAVGGKDVRSWQDFRWVMLQAVLEQPSITVELRTESGQTALRELRLDRVNARDIEGDILATLGFSRLRIAIKPVIGDLTAGGPAARSGLQPGDIVMTADGQPTVTWDDLVARVRAAPGRELQLQVNRGGVVQVLRVTPDTVRAGDNASIGRIGAAPRLDEAALRQTLTTVSYGPFESLPKAVEKTWDTALFSLRMLGKMVVGEVSMKNLSGPITIADYAGQSAQNGWISYLLFLSLISISLGVLNLLPIPLLDGGHLMYYSVEILTGKPVSEKIMEIGQQVGIALLFVLMAFALYNDVIRLIGS